MNLVTGVLTVYIWGIACILLYFLFTIARFYEKKSGRRSFYASFLIPIVVFAGAMVRYALLAPLFVGDVLGDMLRFIGAIVLGGFGFFLLRLMMGGRS